MIIYFNPSFYLYFVGGMTMKRFLSIVLAAFILAATICMGACNKKADEHQKSSGTEAEEKSYADYTAVPYAVGDEIYAEMINSAGEAELSSFKIGIIAAGDDETAYSYVHIKSIERTCELLGLDIETQLVISINVTNESCSKEIKQLAQESCNIVFSTAVEFESAVKKAAKLYPEIKFCQLAGSELKVSKRENVVYYGNDIYEARYVSGIYAGYKLMELKSERADIIKDGVITIGYVATEENAESISAYTSFYLGVKSVVSNPDLYSEGETPVTLKMKVKYTGSREDKALENEAAHALIAQGAVLLCGGGNTTGVIDACETAEDVYYVGTDGIGLSESEYYITSAANNWTAYYCYAVTNALTDNNIDKQKSDGYNAGAVLVTDINKKSYSKADTYNSAVAAANDAIDSMCASELFVFDTSTWTVNAKTVKSTTTKKYKDMFNNLQYIKTAENEISYFAESEDYAAPAFMFVIDGIEVMD